MSRTRTQATWRMIVAMCTAIAVPAAAACEREREVEVGQGAAEPGAQPEIQRRPDVETVAESPARFYGKRITLSGEVEEVANGTRFKLEGADWLFDEEITVVSRSPILIAGERLEEGDEVVVTGVVRPFEANTARDLDLPLEGEVVRQMMGEPVLIAESIDQVGAFGRWSQQNPEGSVVGVITIVTAVEPDVLVDRTVEIDSVPVQAVQGKGMWVGESHRQQVFVAPSADVDVTQFKAGQEVDVRGTLKEMPAAAQAMKQWNLPKSMQSVLKDEALYIQASSVKPVQKEQRQPGQQQPGQQQSPPPSSPRP